MLLLALLLAACGPGGEGAEADTNALSIVATTTILGDVAGQVAGATAQVTTLMEPGADPHNFEVSAQKLAALQEADLVIANGANLEEPLMGPLAEAERAGVPVFSATDHIATLTFTGGHGQEEAPAGHDDDHADDDGHDHDAGAVDPHFWMDPIRMADVARALGEQIGELSGDPDTVTGQAREYAARLEELDGQISETLSSIPDDGRTLVTSHEAFNYFADRYDFTIVGTVIPSLSTGAEPSAQDLEELVHTIEQQRVRAVFTAASAPAQLTQTLAAEVGTDVQVVELHSETLGEEGSGVTTYADMLAANAELVAQALGS